MYSAVQEFAHGHSVTYVAEGPQGQHISDTKPGTYGARPLQHSYWQAVTTTQVSCCTAPSQLPWCHAAEAVEKVSRTCTSRSR